MKQLLKSLSKPFCIAAVAVTQLMGVSQGAHSYLMVDLGYRYDRVNDSLEFFDPALIQGYTSIEFNYHNIQSFVLGGRALWQDSIFCTGLLVKAEGHYGWIGHGNISHNIAQHGQVEGNTVDASGAVGFAIPVCCCFEFVPLVGYGYDKLHFKTKNTFNSLELAPRSFETDIKYFFYGPWAGFDLYADSYLFCMPLSFDLGYEFHFGTAKVDQHDTDDTSRKLNRNRMQGHVFHLGTMTRFCGCWFAGLRFQYTFWSNPYKKENPLTPPLPNGRLGRTVYLDWRSFEATGEIGLTF